MSLRFNPKIDRQLQRLMDRNTEGLLSPDEKEQLESLVELSESLSGPGTGPATSQSATVMTGDSWSEKVRLVEARAGGRCEYCRMHQDLQGATFHVEHILPVSRGGSSELDNLAWCCPGCNLTKSDRVEVADPDSGAIVPLFHPRRDEWRIHFDWAGYRLVGKTPVGRATVAALDLNHARRVRIRQAEEHFGLFPP